MDVKNSQYKWFSYSSIMLIAGKYQRFTSAAKVTGKSIYIRKP
uniref:Uncharacterized protein n=1 Tax=Arundo donax TaxID=35708 RepID=A0A0A8YYU4_ARUDO